MNESTIRRDSSRLLRRRKIYITLTLMILVPVGVVVVYLPTVGDSVRWLVESAVGQVRWLMDNWVMATALAGLLLLIYQASMLAGRFADSQWLAQAGVGFDVPQRSARDDRAPVSASSSTRREWHRSWAWPELSFRVSGELARRAVVRFAVLRDQGAIFVGKDQFRIRNQKWFGESWAMEQRGQVCATAEEVTREGAYCYEVQAEGKLLTLFPCAKGYKIQAQGHVLGNIRGDYLQGSMGCPDSVPEHVQLLFVWLAQLSSRHHHYADRRRN